jgi:ribonuclease P protein component
MDPVNPVVGPISGNEIWLGTMAPKRWAKRAVTRNMIKRQAYTLLSQVQLPLAAYVVRLRAEFGKTQFVSASSVALKVAVRQELHQLLATVASAGVNLAVGNGEPIMKQPTP